MQDLFFETIEVERIELITRLVSMNQCDCHDKELALDWVAELSKKLLEQLSGQDST
ncbi:hypothetical protein [Rahnella laticis]|uniref:hypothetical protein n=1 Tax=Rahnella laticis TaxID=2787622 RepID=UPI0018A325DB|nr:hypothetical protein [Rahnella laticis]MBF7993407.1 hypothetical protein [Rahnella laticis]